MMLSNRVKYNLSWVFLAAFMLIKVAGLHDITHNDDVDDAEDCVWCHLAGTDKNTPIITSEINFEVEDLLPLEPTFVVNNYSSVATEKTPFCLIFNKPPPFYTV